MLNSLYHATACNKMPLFDVKPFLALLLIFLCLNANAQWVRKADELSKRAECNNVVYKNKIFMFGGFGDNPVIEKTNEVYDIATDKWSSIASFPAGKEITHQGIVLVDDNVWLIGGRSVDAYGPASSQVIIYNITTNTWSNGPELIDPQSGKPFAIGAGGYALLGRTIHVFGGFGPTMCEDQANLHLTINVDKYLANKTKVTWENKLAPMPIPRNHISYVTLAGKIYAFGGQFKHDCGAADQVYCHVYDSATDKWTRLTDLPKPRSHAEAATFAVDGKIFLVAGQGYYNQTQNTTYQFDPSANNGLGSWTNLTKYQLPGSYLGLSARLVGNKFIIANGAKNNYADERKETYINTVTRSTARTLGFVNACYTRDVNNDSTITVDNILYCVQDAANYTITSDAAWLKLVNNSGTTDLNGVNIQASIIPKGLSVGSYKGTITATATSTGAKASFCVNLNVKGATSSYTLKVAAQGSGTFTQTPSKSYYLPGEVVSVRATPAQGWIFKGWTGDVTSATNPLAVTMNGNRTLTGTFTKSDATGLITNVVASSGKVYPLAILSTGLVYYTDRTYKTTTVPSVLAQAAVIRTANDDKRSTATDALSFNLTEKATIYIAYDPRATVLPPWLSTWTKRTDKLGIDDPKLSSFNLYSKDFAAGKIILGGNMAGNANGTQCQYIVLAKVTSTTLATASIKQADTDVSRVTSSATDTSVTEQSNTAALQLYPNPATDYFNIVIPANVKGIADMYIIDLEGRSQLLSKADIQVINSLAKVSISNLKIHSGIYTILIVSGEGKKHSMRLMIK